MRFLRHLALLWLVALVAIAALRVVSWAAPERPEITGIALVRLRVSNIDASRAFYATTLGLPQARQGCFSPTGAGACFFVNSGQQIELIPSATPDMRNAVEAIGFHVRDAAAMRQYLLAHGVKCSEVQDSNSKEKFVEARDPENHRILFLSPGGGTLGTLSVSTLSNQIIHAGFIVHDRTAEDVFYKDILGFHLYWQGGMKEGGETNWVSMQVPNGTSWLEYMLNVPSNADHRTVGVMNHIALGVMDIRKADAQLIKNGWKPTEEPKMGRDGKWQLNLYDPDETRIEFMEFKPAEKPCCSPFTGTHPGPQ
jgi:catechol 2,3-dioxygenase-like lactoylglutathione lyase family enzyme